MVRLALPADTVQFYNDGPEAPLTHERVIVEWEYRQAFAKAAGEVVQWDMPDPDAIQAAREARQRARLAAEVRVESSILYRHPHLDSEQIVYRKGHEAMAARTRGRCQALEMAKQLWWELSDAGVSDQAIRDSIMRPWFHDVADWAMKETKRYRVVPPPRPEDFMTGDQRRHARKEGERQSATDAGR